ncbi:hypothetical protein [Desulfovibrio aminophilus]|uniref:hypothetical protein n=1 Tax=Desulfovibrio aminophilus TaxID=81425 RepID=UPI0004886C6E|nr:hypothetical protein [Desulfovibrio aminophilus]
MGLFGRRPNCDECRSAVDLVRAEIDRLYSGFARFPRGEINYFRCGICGQACFNVEPVLDDESGECCPQCFAAACRDEKVWSSECPGIPGWYWFKRDDGRGMVIIRLVESLDGMGAWSATIPGVLDPETMRGQWWGPIPAPEESAMKPKSRTSGSSLHGLKKQMLQDENVRLTAERDRLQAQVRELENSFFCPHCNAKFPTTPDGAIEALEHEQTCKQSPIVQERDRLREALTDLAAAEMGYRIRHDVHGDGSLHTGRAWDRMRWAGDKARAALQPAGGES